MPGWDPCGRGRPALRHRAGPSDVERPLQAEGVQAVGDSGPSGQNAPLCGQEPSKSRAGVEQEPGGSRVGDGAVCAAVARIARAIVPLGIAHGVRGVYASALRPLCVLPSVTLSGIKHLSLGSQRKVVIACTTPDAE